MSTVKVDTIKPVTSGADLSLQGDSGGSAVDCLNIDSSGNVDFSGNTDAKIKLPSAGGIYESDGSTAVLTESGGVVSLGTAVVVAGVGATGSIVKVHGPYTYANVTGVTSAGALSGVTQALTVGTGNDLIVVPDITVRRTAGGVTAWGAIYVTGGSLGATTSGFSLDGGGYAGNQVNDHANQYYSAHILDSTPTTSPTYAIYANPGGGGTWTFHNIKFTFFEIKG